MFLDPMYFIIVGPFALLGMVASMRVKGTFEKYSRVGSSARVSGAEAAAMMLRAAGIQGVRIERVEGFLADHYDPRTRTVRLSPAVHDSTSLAALGVACHEVGHAIQHARKYTPLVIRNAAVPAAGFGSSVGGLMFIVGLILSGMGIALGQSIAWLGVLLFAGVVVFQIVNLPVEFNASTRAKEMLNTMGLVRPGPEAAAVSSVLGAAALTYVAGTLQAVAQLAYYAYLLLGHRRQE